MTDKAHVFMRAVPAQVNIDEPRQDGARLLTGRLVPYDLPALVMDEKPAGERPDIYEEGFKRGAFDGQVKNSATNKGVLQKIGFIHRHDGGLGYLGPFVGLRDEVDGLYGDVLVLPGLADNVGTLISAGVDELSIEFRLPGDTATNTVTDGNGVRWRTKAHLDQVALEPKGAYRTAQVLQFRSELDDLARQAAEAAANEEAEAARLAEEAATAEAAAQEAIDRRRQWDELTGRFEMARARQDELTERYGPKRTQREELTKNYGAGWQDGLR